MIPIWKLSILIACVFELRAHFNIWHWLVIARIHHSDQLTSTFCQTMVDPDFCCFLYPRGPGIGVEFGWDNIACFPRIFS